MSPPPPHRSLSAHSVIDVVIMSLETFEHDLNCVEKYILLMIIIYVLIFVRGYTSLIVFVISRDICHVIHTGNMADGTELSRFMTFY